MFLSQTTHPWFWLRAVEAGRQYLGGDGGGKGGGHGGRRASPPMATTNKGNSHSLGADLAIATVTRVISECTFAKFFKRKTFIQDIKEKVGG